MFANDLSALVQTLVSGRIASPHAGLVLENSQKIEAIAPRRAGNRWRVNGPPVTGAWLDAGKFARDLLATNTPQLIGKTPVVALLPKARGVLDRCEIIADAAGDISIPSRASGTAIWRTDGTPAAPADGSVTAGAALSPREVVAFLRVSRLLALQAEPQNMLLADMRLAVVEALEFGIIAGDGTGAAPTGLLSAAGVVSVAANVAATPAIVGDLAEAAIKGGADPASTVVVCGPSVFKKVAGTAPDGDGASGRTFIGGFETICSRSVPVNAAVAGDFSLMVVVIYGPGVEVATDPFSSFVSGQVGLRVGMYVDLAPRLPGAFSKATGLT